jgi:hypothetical protein
LHDSGIAKERKVGITRISRNLCKKLSQSVTADDTHGSKMKTQVNSNVFAGLLLIFSLLIMRSAEADLIYQAKPSPAAWRNAGTLVLKGTTQIWSGLEAFERGDRESARSSITGAAEFFTTAAEIYPSVSKKSGFE